MKPTAGPFHTLPLKFSKGDLFAPKKSTFGLAGSSCSFCSTWRNHSRGKELNSCYWHNNQEHTSGHRMQSLECPMSVEGCWIPYWSQFQAKDPEPRNCFREAGWLPTQKSYDMHPNLRCKLDTRKLNDDNYYYYNFSNHIHSISKLNRCVFCLLSCTIVHNYNCSIVKPTSLLYLFLNIIWIN